MEQEEINKGNKLIAEFMGTNKQPDRIDSDVYEYELYGILECINDGENEQHFFTPDQMLFHTSWNWLMPVVQKIDQTGASVIIGRMFCEIKYINPLNQNQTFDVRIASGVKRNAIVGAVTEFINWYNERKI